MTQETTTAWWKDLINLASEAMPPPVHRGSCGPETACDMDCVNRAAISDIIDKARRKLVALLAALEMQADVDMLAGAIQTSWTSRIVEIVERHPALLTQDMSEENALNILRGAALETRSAALAKARGES